MEELAGKEKEGLGNDETTHGFTNQTTRRCRGDGDEPEILAEGSPET